MYDLRLTSEQLEFRDTVREFVDAEVRPVSLHPSRLEPLEKPFLGAVLDKAARIGLRTVSLQEELGGAGADALTTCIVMEELGAGDPDIAMALGTTAHLAQLLFDRLTTPAQRSRLLPAFLDDDRAHLAVLGVEPVEGAGWRYHRSDAEPQHRAIRAAREADGRWRLDGEASFVANAPLASLLIVRARTADAGARDVAFVLPAATPGLRIGAPPAGSTHPNSGRGHIPWHHGTGAALTFERCRVPEDYLLPDDAWDGAHADRWSLQIAAMNLGVGRAAFEAALDYAKLRVQGGRPIVQHQSIGTLLADSAIKLENARNLIWKAAWAADHPEAIAERSMSDLPLATMARVYTAEAMHEVALAAAECFGAMGVMRDMPLQKYVHDTLVFLHGAGHDSATRLEITEAIAGFRREAA